MVDLKEIKNIEIVDDPYDTGIGTNFSAETNRRDEDAEMYVNIIKNPMYINFGNDTDQLINK